MKIDSFSHAVDYKTLSKEVDAAIRKDKEEFVSLQCEELEKQSKNGNSRSLFQAVRKLTGHFQPRLNNI